MLEFGYEENRDASQDSAPVPTPTVKTIEAGDTYGVFVVEPLPRGYGHTLGSPMRRVLLSAIPGTAVSWVRVEGVQHEYSTVPHVKEDVVDILLNVKAIYLRSLTNRPGKLRLEAQGPGEVTAGDIMASSDFEIVNPELHIATLDSDKAKLMMEMNVEQGKGYRPAAHHTGLPIGVLPVDAVFTPVRKVNYTVERTRVGQHTDFERLLLEVWTNGAISPAEAVRTAAKELVEHFFRFSNLSEDASAEGDRPSWASAIPASQYNMPVESLGLSVRTLNCLKRASIHKVGEVLERSRPELLRIRNFGEKSLDELNEKLQAAGIKHPDLQAAPVTAGAPSEAGMDRDDDGDDTHDKE
ncbi:MAG: DNA-directed RNA polymerase subunit alpha [SAR202 cluster bacterium]|nr:DNA-directed RNA polymerase subunit alpha [SAR202 cluster bacterium]